MTRKPQKTDKICSNRKAFFEYHIVDKIEAGIVLVGTEVKSCRNHKVSLDSSYAVVRDNELWLIGSNFEQYGNYSHEPKRERKLLLKKREINKFALEAKAKGFTLIPLQIYFSENGFVKVELALCKGKQLHDKRESIKQKDQQREMRI